MSVALVKHEVSVALSQIKRLFVPQVELTFIARLPGNDYADFVLTNDKLSEVAKVVARSQTLAGEESEIRRLRTEAERLQEDNSRLTSWVENDNEIFTALGFTVPPGPTLADARKLAAELATLRDLERSYSQQLGEMARLCDIFFTYIDNEDPVAAMVPFPADVAEAANAIMEYVEAVRPPEGPPSPEWVVHILGPDDAIPCVSQFDALRKANEINREWAKWSAENPSPNNPVQIAVVKTAGEVNLPQAMTVATAMCVEPFATAGLPAPHPCDGCQSVCDDRCRKVCGGDA